jgi:hypothetical protein
MTAADKPPVPAGSSPLRELCHAIELALTLPRPATERDELIYLRIMRDRSRQVVAAMKRLLLDYEADDEDIMTMVMSLRGHIAVIPDDQPGYQPEPTVTASAQEPS